MKFRPDYIQPVFGFDRMRYIEGERRSSIPKARRFSVFLGISLQQTAKLYV